MSQFDGIVTGVTIAHLTGEKLKALEVQVPPLSLQTKFAAFVEQADKSKFVMLSGIKTAVLRYEGFI